MRIVFRGIVQGVGFRPAVYKSASELGLSGQVWNDGPDVIAEVSDGDLFLNSFLSCIPPLARIDRMITSAWSPAGGGFRILPSVRGMHGVSVPTDAAICKNCLDDMKEGRRAGYPFTSCTDCGPRFTLLRDTPYDRAFTAMSDFGLCPECAKEYSDPENRRFHHQTICCPRCGPKYRLTDSGGNEIPGDPVSIFSDMLARGKIGVVKGWGGMHICCTAENIKKMRGWYGREQKPFALMVRDTDAVRRYGSPSPAEMEELASPHRPIVLISKKQSDVTDLLSPGLNNVGIFLPYTGIQHLIFRYLGDDALLMTSANMPGEPMIIGDGEILKIGADAYLLHDQPIINRADDSVIRMFGTHRSFIRKSRGHVPSFISTDLRGSAVAVGAQENLTGSVAAGGSIYPTQHIGDGNGLGVPEYLEDSVRMHMKLLGCEPQAVAMDMHPGYANRDFARRLSEEYGSELIEVQHHWAHAASLMADNSKDCVAALTLDGSGYGSDGTVWGGEVLISDLLSFSRIAHLEEIPLLGSEKALYDLRRLRFAIDTMNKEHNGSFSDEEASILGKMMKNSVKCSSMGRLIDALSYSLGICSVRTYDGEPAMKLEPLLESGRLIEGFETEISNGTIRTAHLFSGIKKGQRPADVAYSIVYNVMKCLTESAADAADSKGIGALGITGGVSYNSTVCRIFSETAGNSGHELIFHRSIPNGDGGISAGQAAVALKRIG
ncbi:MAG: carbamoyltransferase HypF [Candidatus Methanoplasma sp.]|nr:carbamoyltransferase HypF [Candidatus Methanoplasma sp.]